MYESFFNFLSTALGFLHSAYRPCRVGRETAIQFSWNVSLQKVDREKEGGATTGRAETDFEAN
jgi:hypothetical protein